MRERNFSSRPDFSEYVLVEQQTGEVYTSPFVVAVMGIHGEMLGMGRLIGKTDEVLGENPVIELDDPTSPTGNVEILGIECWWSPTGDKGDEMAGLYAQKADYIVPVAAYISTLA